MDKLGSKTIIGAGASFNGKITNARVIEINGKMNADLTADKVTIGETGHFDGAILADLVVVSGHYEGKMQAGSVWATATASISGKLHYETLQMDRGAALNCHVVHNWKAKNTVAPQSDNNGADLLLPTILDKAKNGSVPTPPEEGA
ncbi:polymer-forming cytoskeletal protein [Alphaproteobacteria bacterium]|nr:polymer-forming cytoskeletal protein [Alphaproteobacteria bacterium]